MGIIIDPQQSIATGAILQCSPNRISTLHLLHVNQAVLPDLYRGAQMLSNDPSPRLRQASLRDRQQTTSIPEV